MISEDGLFLGPFSLRQWDATTASQASIICSGAIRVVPLPSVVALLLPVSSRFVCSAGGGKSINDNTDRRFLNS